MTQRVMEYNKINWAESAYFGNCIKYSNQSRKIEVLKLNEKPNI